MANITHPNTITAFVNFNPEAMLCTARFAWDNAQPTHTYTIDCYDASLEIDRHNIARPAALNWRPGEHPETAVCIQQAFGSELQSEMSLMIEEGAFSVQSIQVDLCKSRRLFIARKQLESPSTPYKLLRLLHHFIADNDHIKEQAPTEPHEM